MTLDGLKGTYARLREEINSLGGSVDRPIGANVSRLMSELDQVERDLAAYRVLARGAPTLSDIVPGFDAPQARPANA